MQNSTVRAPQAGQKWHIPDFSSKEIRLSTLVGTYLGSASTPVLRDISVHVLNLAPGSIDSQVPHPEDEFYYVISGSRDLVVGSGANQIRVELSQGDFVYVPANEYHIFEGKNGISLLVIFTPDYSGRPNG